MDDEQQMQPMAAQGQQQNPLGDYWPNKPPKDVIEHLQTVAKNQWHTLNQRGVPTLWRIIYAQVHGVDPATGMTGQQLLAFCGTQARHVRFRVAMTRTHIKQRNQLAKGPRLALRAVAQNNDARNLMQVKIAAKGLSYLIREARAEEALSEALDADGYFGIGYVWTRWDRDGGDTHVKQQQVPAQDERGQPIIDPTGNPMMRVEDVPTKTGAPSFQPLYPWETLRDITVRKSPWFRCSEKVSKSELIARYPQHAERIKSMSLKIDAEPGTMELLLWDRGKTTTDDTLVVHHFYHQADATCPGGRYLGYVQDLDLWDAQCPVSKGVPITPLCSAKYLATSIGYPESADLIAQQEMYDELMSQWASNALRYGNQNLWGEDGVEFDQERFAQGGSFFTMKSGQKPPQVIDWNSIPEGTRYLVELIPRNMAEISGMNSTVRGNPESNISSGVFASLMESIAEKFISPTQEAYDFAATELGNITLQLIRDNAEAEFLVNVAGNSSAPYMRAFSAGDVAGVHSVYVERQSPVMNSIPGRFEIFERTWQMPKDERAAAVMLLKTGDDSAYTDMDLSADVLIEYENEQLMRGVEVDVSSTDDPKLHGPCHAASLDRLRAAPPPPSPDPRMPSPEQQAWQAAVNAHVAHLGLHAVTWAQTDPVYAAMLGNPQPPMPDPMQGRVMPAPGTTDKTPKQGGPRPAPSGGGAHKTNNPALPAAAGQPGQPGKPANQKQGVDAHG